MTFLHAGLAAAAVGAVAIPILIHLLMRRRRRPVMWGAMRFLLEAYRRQRRRLMVERWLLLATRCLLVLLAGLAIARPLLGGGLAGAGGRTVYVLIDNGLAAAASEDGTPGGSALERHKRTAISLVSGLSGFGGRGAAGGGGGGGVEGDRVGLIALGGPAEAIVAPPSADIGAVVRLIESLEAADSRTDIAGGLALAGAAISAEREKSGGQRAGERVYVAVLSDFREGSLDVGTAAARLPADVTVMATLPATTGLDNVAISSVEPLRPVVLTGGPGTAGAGGREQVRVTVRRSGPGVSAEAVSTVRVQVAMLGETVRRGGAGAGETEGRAAVRFAPGQDEASGAVQVPVSTARRSVGDGAEQSAVLVARIDNDAVGADNAWRRPLEVKESLRVGIVAPRRFGDRARVDQLEPAEWVRLALAPAGADSSGFGGGGGAGGIEIVEIEPGGVDGGRLVGLDAVFFPRPDLVADDAWRRVRAFIQNGGLAVVMPPPEAEVHLWTDGMVKELGIGLKLSREAVAHGVGGAGLPLGAGDAVDTARPDGGGGGGDLLSLLRAELEEIMRPVTVYRSLRIEAEPAGERGEIGEVVLRVGGWGAFVWAGPVSNEPGGGVTVSPGTALTPSGEELNPGAGRERGAARGLVVVIGAAMDLGWTDLPARPLMVPLMQELVRQGVGRAKGSAWSLAGRPVAAPARAAELRAIEDPARSDSGGAGTGGAGEASVGAELDEAGLTREPFRRAGVWRAVDDRGVVRGVVAVNADPRAGRTGVQGRGDVESWLKTAAENPAGTEIRWLGGGEEAGVAGEPGGGAGAVWTAMGEGEDGPPFSLPLLITAAALALLEIWIARRASHAEIGPDAAGVTA